MFVIYDFAPDPSEFPYIYEEILFYFLLVHRNTIFFFIRNLNVPQSFDFAEGNDVPGYTKLYLYVIIAKQ